MSRRRNNNKEHPTRSKGNKERQIKERDASKSGEPIKDGSTDKEIEAPKSNDPVWYKKDEALFAAASNIPWSYPFGSILDTLNQASKQVKVHQVYDSENTACDILDSPELANKVGVGGVCALYLRPSLGHNDDLNSPANICANMWYAHVRSKIAGRKNYDPSDLLMYGLTIADIYSFIFWCKRIYKLAFMYSMRNLYFNYALLRAEGLTDGAISDLKSNLANFRVWLNIYINKVSTFALPNDIELLKRKAFLYSNVYLENPYGNIKDQMYMYVPESFYRYEVEPATSTGAGSLKQYDVHSQMTASSNVLDTIQQIGQDLLENIFGDEDFGLISGDVLKASEGNIIGIGLDDIDEPILPVFDPMVLSQFKNARIFNKDRMKKWVTVGGWNILIGNVYQNSSANANGGNIISAEGTDVWDVVSGTSTPNAERLLYQMRSYAQPCLRNLISVENPAPGGDDVIEATRLQPMCDVDNPIKGSNTASSSKDYWVFPVHGGTEIAVRCNLFYYKRTQTSTNPPQQYDEVYKQSFMSNLVLGDNSIASYNDEVEIMKMAAQFKYCPILFELHYKVNDQDQTELFITGTRVVSNLDNYTFIDSKALQNLNEVALLSLLYSHGIAKQL